jgi:site-specific DNA-cytosine methylase
VTHDGEVPIPFDTTQITHRENRSRCLPGDLPGPAKGAHPPAIAFSSKDHGADVTVDLSPTLRAGVHDASHANAGVPPAIAFHATQDPISGEVAVPDPAYALADNSGQRTGSGRDAQDTFVISHAPRRLTPTECERLQNFPDGWTAWGVKDGERIDIRDGPRYRMLGNAVTASVAEWVGQRIMAVN